MIDKNVRISVLAEKAGVSAATISRFINHPEQLSAKTRQLVERAMDELEISALGPTKKSSKNKVILFSLHSYGNPFIDEITEGIQSSVKMHGYRLIISREPVSADTLDDYIEYLRQLNVSGIIINNRVEKRTLERLNRSFPVVQLCEYIPDTDIPYVRIDDYGAGVKVTEYLLMAQRRKIAFIGAMNNLSFSTERLRGFRDVLEKHNINIPSSWVVQLPNLNYNLSYSSVCHLLESDIRPNAIIGVSDIYAISAIKAARDCNLKVPDDVSIVGFDNIEVSSIVTPALTTINQPRYQMGFSACELLLESLNGPENPVNPIIYNTELIIRDSSPSMRSQLSGGKSFFSLQ